MLEHSIEPQLLKAFKELTGEARKIVVTCHINPDGDALGSNLALARLLSRAGKEAVVVAPDNVPDDMAFLPGYDGIVPFPKAPDKAKELLGEADLICCLDFNGLKRVGAMGAALGEAPGKKLMIDHHLYPEDFCDLIISRPEMTSTCELLYRIIFELGEADSIDKETAECIYTGMMTDTGNFAYNSNKPELYLMVADLVRKGVDKDRVYKLTLGTCSEARLRLNCYAIAQKMRIYPRHNASLTILDRYDLKKFHYQIGDTETLANMPLAIPGVKWSTFFREEKGFVKVARRSEGDFLVNTLCARYFNGGGHANAAGGEFRGSLSEAIKTYHNILHDLTEKQSEQ